MTFCNHSALGEWQQMRSTLSEFITRMALAAAIALVVAACGGNSPQLNTPAPNTSEPVPGEIKATARKLLADELAELDPGYSSQAEGSAPRTRCRPRGVVGRCEETSLRCYSVRSERRSSDATR